MFETGLSFFQNKSCRTEYDKKLKQLKNHIQPKQIITYKLKLSPEASCNLKPCPLELKPAKLSDTVIQFGHVKRKENSKKKRKHHRRNKHKEAQESKSVQTNVDDSILSGLQTVIDLCGLLEKCEEKKHNVKKSKRKSKKCRKYAEFTNHSYQTALETSTSRDSIPFNESYDFPNTKKFSSEIGSFRKLFSRKSGTQIKYTCSNTSSDATPPAESMNQQLYRQSFHVLSTQQLGVPQSETQNNLGKQLPAPQFDYGDSFKKSPGALNCSGFVSSMTPIEEEPLIYFNSSPSYCEKLDKPHVTSVLSEHYNEQQDNSLIISRRPGPIYPTNMSCLRVTHEGGSHESQIQEIDARQSSLQSIAGERPNKSRSLVGLVPSDTSTPENQYNSNLAAPCVPSVCPSVSNCDTSNCHILNPEVTDYSTSNHCNRSTCPILGSRQLNNSSTLSQRVPPCSFCSNSQRRVTLSARCFSPIEVVPTSPSNNAALEVDNRERVASTNYSLRSIDYSKIAQSESSVQTPTRHVSIYEPETLCNPEFREPLYKGQIECKKSRPGIPLVQPIVGFCSNRKCGATEHLKSIRYALVKISEFMGFNTYEIMKPYKQKPKHIPTCIAEIFVTSSQKEDDVRSSASMQEKYASVQFRDSSRKSVTGLRSKTLQPSSPVYIVQQAQPCKDPCVCSSRRSEFTSLQPSGQQSPRDLSTSRTYTSPRESVPYVYSESQPHEPSSLAKYPSSKGVSKTSYAEPMASGQQSPRDLSTSRTYTSPRESVPYVYSESQPHEPSSLAKYPSSKGVSKTSYAEPMASGQQSPRDLSTSHTYTSPKESVPYVYSESQPHKPSSLAKYPSSKGVSKTSYAEPMASGQQSPRDLSTSRTYTSPKESVPYVYSESQPHEPSSLAKYPSSKGVSKTSYAEPIASVRMIPTEPSIKQPPSEPLTYDKQSSHPGSEKSVRGMKSSTRELYAASQDQTKINYKSESRAPSVRTSEEIYPSGHGPDRTMSYKQPSSPKLSTEQPITSQQSSNHSKRFSKKSMKEAHPEETALSREPSGIGDVIQPQEPSTYSRPVSRTSYREMSNIQQEDPGIGRQGSSKKSIRKSSQQVDGSRTSYVQTASGERSLQKQPSLSYHDNKPETIAAVSRSKEASVVGETIRSREPSTHSRVPTKVSSIAISNTQQRSDFDSRGASKKSFRMSSQQIDAVSREPTLQPETTSELPTSREMSSLSKSKVRPSNSREPDLVGEAIRSREPSTHSRTTSRIGPVDSKVASKKSVGQRIDASKIGATSREQTSQHQPSYHEIEVTTSRGISSDRHTSGTNHNDEIIKSHSSHRNESMHSTNKREFSGNDTHQSFHSTRSKNSENNRDTFYLIQPNIPNYKQNLYHCVHLPK